MSQPNLVLQSNDSLTTVKLDSSRETIMSFIITQSMKDSRLSAVNTPISYNGNLFSVDFVAFAVASMSRTRQSFRWRTYTNSWVTISKDDVCTLLDMAIDQAQLAFESMEQSEINSGIN